MLKIFIDIDEDDDDDNKDDDDDDDDDDDADDDDDDDDDGTLYNADAMIYASNVAMMYLFYNIHGTCNGRSKTRSPEKENSYMRSYCILCTHIMNSVISNVYIYIYICIYIYI